MKRREFLGWSVSAVGLALLNMAGLGCQEKASEQRLELPDLPYGRRALEPYLSKRTLEVHYEKHHQGYVNRTNRLIHGTAYQGLPLEKIIQKAARENQRQIFNNAAQVYNHTFYWKSMAPKGGGAPAGLIRNRIEADFGSLEGFRRVFFETAGSLFGSGWLWLVCDQAVLKIVATSNADTPLARGKNPLLALDLWEHAYYLDYQNRREDYIKAYYDHLVNWRFAEANLVGCSTGAPQKS